MTYCSNLICFVLLVTLSACGSGTVSEAVVHLGDARVQFGDFSYPSLDSSAALGFEQSEDSKLAWRRVDSTFVRFLFEELAHGDYDAVVQDGQGEHLKTIYRGAFKRGVNEIKFNYAHLSPGAYRWLLTDYGTGDTLQWSEWTLLPPPPPLSL